MSGLFNSNIRDYCGNESAISKLSNHFSKDYTLQEKGITQNNIPNINQLVPTSFHLNDLLQNAMENEKHASPNSLHQQNNYIAKSNCETTNHNANTSMDTDRTISAHNIPFISPTYFSVPQPYFSAPDHSLVAQEWARCELAQFDNEILTEEDLKALSQSNELNESNLRFSDIIRNMTLEEEQKEIAIFSDDLKQANGDFLYDLDRDLKLMREKLISSDETSDMWPQIQGGLYDTPQEFVFIKENHYAESLKSDKENQNKKIEEMLNKGIKLYQEGYFSEAMLIFEAVVQVNGELESAWHYLALSLSENEQDHRAAVACKKCLDLNKDDLEILLSLARVHCNEMNISSTIGCLERWLLSNTKYSDLATVGQEALHTTENNDESMWQTIYEDSFGSSGQFAIIEQQLNSAQERNGLNKDPDVEIALGTLYHVIQDYSKSTLHFENAAKLSSNNALLWNKLGTGYCNSGEFDKAIETYQRALELAPGFVRAECNLGVSFFNMGNYREAIKHALKAHKLQHSITSSLAAQSSLGGTEMSETVFETDPIWTLIRMSCFKIDRPDLDLVVFNRDVDTLNKEFEV